MTRTEAIKKIKGFRIVKIPDDILKQLYSAYELDKEFFDSRFSIMKKYGNCPRIEIGEQIRFIDQESFETPLTNLLLEYVKPYGSFNQIELRYYMKQYQLPPHIDMGDHTIIMINFIGRCTLSMSFNNDIYNIRLKTGEMVILNDDARFKWHHSISKPTNGRISIIMRKLN